MKKLYARGDRITGGFIKHILKYTIARATKVWN